MQAGVTLCASARIIAMALCLCLSVSSRSVETDEQIGLVLAWELPSAYPTLRLNEIRVPPKMRVLLSKLHT